MGEWPLLIFVVFIILAPWAAARLLRKWKHDDQEAEKRAAEIVTPTRFVQRDPNLLTRARVRGAKMRFRDNPAKR